MELLLTSLEKTNFHASLILIILCKQWNKSVFILILEAAIQSGSRKSLLKLQLIFWGIIFERVLLLGKTPSFNVISIFMSSCYSELLLAPSNYGIFYEPIDLIQRGFFVSLNVKQDRWENISKMESSVRAGIFLFQWNERTTLKNLFALFFFKVVFEAVADKNLDSFKSWSTQITFLSGGILWIFI